LPEVEVEEEAEEAGVDERTMGVKVDGFFNAGKDDVDTEGDFPDISEGSIGSSKSLGVRVKFRIAGFNVHPGFVFFFFGAKTSRYAGSLNPASFRLTVCGFSGGNL
jgi:hypothetical protein